MVVLKSPDIDKDWFGDESEMTEDQLLADALNDVSDRRERLQLLSRIASVWIADWLVKHPGPQVQSKALVKELYDEGLIEDTDNLLANDKLKPFLSGRDTPYAGTQLNEVMKSREEVSVDESLIPSSPGDVSPFLSQVYLTELSKVRSPTGEWPFWLHERYLQRDHLQAEIELIEPEVVITLGKRPGDVAFEIAETDTEENHTTYTTQNGSQVKIVSLSHPSYPQADYAETIDSIPGGLHLQSTQ
jgi:hypothetical protein